MGTGAVPIVNWFAADPGFIVLRMDTITADLPTTLLDWAASFGSTLQANAERYDREGDWVADSYAALVEGGLLGLAVPVELGGRGASIGQVALVMRELGRHCGSTALAMSMHQHATAFTAWRYRRGLPGAEATLRRVVDDGLVIASTGGGDATTPQGDATRVEGGYRVSGRKRFVSQSPRASVMSSMFTYDDPERGRRVLNVPVPFGDGVTVLDNWDTMGMRGTASNDVVIDGVFIPDEKVLADRPYGVVDGPLQVIFSIGLSIISAVYLGVTDGAVDAAIAAVGPADDATTQRRIGLMVHRRQVASWALDGALDAVGDDPSPSMEMLAAVMAAKREIALTGVEVCDLAQETVGGRSYFRGSPIERAVRDVRAAKMHPFDPETTLLHGGRLALGRPCDVV